MRSGRCVKAPSPYVSVPWTSLTLPTARSHGTHRKPYRRYGVRMRAVMPIEEPVPRGASTSRRVRRAGGVGGGRARGKGNEMMTDGHGRGLEARVHLELGQDALNMGPDGISTDAQSARDRSSVGPLHEEAEHLPLARGELSDEQGDAVGRSTTMTC